LGLLSDDAEELMIGTLAQESSGGTFLRQKENGPGLGPFSMQVNCHDDIWNVVLPHNTILTHNLLTHCMLIIKPRPEMLIYHLGYATAMARIQYFRFKEPIPKTIEGKAEYWKRLYNKKDGAGTEEEFVKNYYRFIGGKNESSRSQESGERTQKGNEERVKKEKQ
jgi:hypothetical protein